MRVIHFRGRILFAIRQMCPVLFLIFIGIPSVFAASEDIDTNQFNTGQIDPGNTALLLDIKGPIGPAVSDYIQRGLQTAQTTMANIVIIRMDTPGGLDSSMRTIIKDIIASPIAVIGYVAPGGARAASAGTYILYASHIAAMAPGTNLGAATPVSIGLPKMPGQPPEPKPDPATDQSTPPEAETTGDKTARPSESPPPKPATTMERKVINDATAYIRSLAELRGRNANWGEDAVRKASSLSAVAALKANVIDVVAPDLDQLLANIDGRVVKIQDQSHILITRDLTILSFPPDWRSQFLNVITNPNVAIILMMIGMYGLVFEFANPGYILPGVVGAISLILAFYAFETLPINYAGLGLIILGIAFLIGEAFIPSFGALGLGGGVALVIGLVMLVDTKVPGFGVTWQFIALISATSIAFFLAVVTLASKAHRRPIETGEDIIVGCPGKVISWNDGAGRVRVQGEIWSAVSETDLLKDQPVEVTFLDGLTVGVIPTGIIPRDPDMIEGKGD